MDIRDFVADWKSRGSEKSDAQMFWIELLEILGLDQPTQKVNFEYPVEVDEHKCFIDVLIPSTKVLIEQKSRGVDLDKPARQSDGKFLTPFQQAKRYAAELPYSLLPRWIVTCNFDELRIYDLNQLPKLADLSVCGATIEPQIIRLEQLLRESKRLNFLIDREDENVYPEIRISKRAGEVVGDMYRALEKQLGIRNAQLGIETSALNSSFLISNSSLSRLCVRLVFCLYAEDDRIFEQNQFTDYLRGSSDRRQALIDLFRVLDTPKELRADDLDPRLKAFPYVDGELFKVESDIPNISQDAAHYILVKLDDEASWAGINPTIFGALFESTINSAIRRRGGMHYTSIENIHRVIDPLFLDDLHNEFQKIRRKRKNKLRELEMFQDKIAALTFFDPACGSGNFLTETYISLRTLENEVIRELLGEGGIGEIKVSIENFFGVEINDFAVAVAQTAMLIAENQTRGETEMILNADIQFLPLTRMAHITRGNALRIDWNEIVPDGVDYIIGNPPFSGARFMTPENKSDLLRVFDGWKNAGDLDFVTCWFKRASDFMIGTQTRAAFVATNSIMQGESVGNLWSKLLEIVHIDFAWRTFKWLSESDDMAAVHCVIVGFSHAPSKRKKLIITDKQKIVARNINGYLIDAPNFFVERRSKPLCNVPKMGIGNKPIDAGNYLFTPEEMDEFVRREPRAKKYFRPFVGSEEFINGKRRYCLWLGEATPDEINSMPPVAARVEYVRQFRLSRTSTPTRLFADKPTRFHVENMPPNNFIMVPRVSGERRKYVPIGLMPSTVIASDATLIIPVDDRCLFGVLQSIVHMAWMRVVAGYLGTSYRYSASIVYNNFVWCERSARIESTAQSILDVRERYLDRTLASLYDDQCMPNDLRAAHEANDAAVLEAYGFSPDMSEDEIVSRLMLLYAARSKQK